MRVRGRACVRARRLTRAGSRRTHPSPSGRRPARQRPARQGAPGWLAGRPGRQPPQRAGPCRNCVAAARRRGRRVSCRPAGPGRGGGVSGQCRLAPRTAPVTPPPVPPVDRPGRWGSGWPTRRRRAARSRRLSRARGTRIRVRGTRSPHTRRKRTLLLGCIIICNTQDYLKFNPDTFSAMFMLPLFIEHDTIESKPVFRDTISLGFCINAHSSVFNAFKKLFDSDFSHALTAVDVINDDGYGNVYIRGARRRSPHARSRRRLPHTRSPHTGSRRRSPRTRLRRRSPRVRLRRRSPRTRLRRRSPRTRLRLEPRGLSEHIGCHK